MHNCANHKRTSVHTTSLNTPLLEASRWYFCQEAKTTQYISVTASFYFKPKLELPVQNICFKPKLELPAQNICSKPKLELPIQNKISDLAPTIKVPSVCRSVTTTNENDHYLSKIKSVRVIDHGCDRPFLQAYPIYVGLQHFRREKTTCINILFFSWLLPPLFLHKFSQISGAIQKKHSPNLNQVPWNDSSRCGFAGLTDNTCLALGEATSFPFTCFQSKAYAFNILHANIRDKGNGNGGLDKMSDEKDKGLEDDRDTRSNQLQPPGSATTQWESHSPIDYYQEGCSRCQKCTVISSNLTGEFTNNPLEDNVYGCIADSESVIYFGSEEDEDSSNASPITKNKVYQFLKMLRIQHKKSNFPSKDSSLNLLKTGKHDTQNNEIIANDLTNDASRNTKDNETVTSDLSGNVAFKTPTDNSKENEPKSSTEDTASENYSMVIDSTALTPSELKLEEFRSPVEGSQAEISRPGESSVSQTQRLSENLIEAIKLAAQEMGNYASDSSSPEASTSKDEESASIEEFDDYLHAKARKPAKINDSIMVALQKKHREGVKFYGYASDNYDFLDFNDPVTSSSSTPPVTKKSSSMSSISKKKDKSGSKKGVHFADRMGLSLTSVRQIKDSSSPPLIPDSVFANLKLENDIDATTVPSKYLSAIFSQPGADTNFVRKVQSQKVCLENVMVTNMTIQGFVRVANISLKKRVYVRYTCDRWYSFHEVDAIYVEGSCNGPTERFSFLIHASPFFLPGSRLELAVSFTSDEQEFWDNNGGHNYAFECLSVSSSRDDISVRLEM